MIRPITGMALMVVACTSLPAFGDTIVMTGVEPWHLCATCHSLDGISRMARFPKLAGQRAAYIVKQVHDFRDGRRENDGGQMQASAADIGDEDLARVAAYFAGLPPPPPDTSVATDGEDWRRGAALYRDGDTVAGLAPCGTCHEDVEGRGPAGPQLKAQHAAYLAKQLREWRSGERANDPAMAASAARLSDADIEAVAAFLASQPRPPSNDAPKQ